jgi:hypothetical protein
MMSKAEFLVVLVVIASLGLAACAGSQPASGTALENLTGVWKEEGDPVFLQLKEDGAYAFAEVGPAFLEKAPFDAGQFRLDGTVLTFISNDETVYCAGQTGSYQVALTEQGQLQFELEEDACPERASGVPGSWSWYEP